MSIQVMGMCWPFFAPLMSSISSCLLAFILSSSIFLARRPTTSELTDQPPLERPNWLTSIIVIFPGFTMSNMDVPSG